MAAMGSHQALRYGKRLARANAVRQGARGVGIAPHAEHRERWLNAAGLQRGRAFVRRNQLFAIVTAVVAAVSAGVGFAAAAAARHNTSSPRLTSATKATQHAAGSSAANARALAAAQATAANLNISQLAGQRVIYSYTGLNPPAGLLRLIRHGEVAGIIFFSGNVGTEAHLAGVVKKLQNANAATTNPVREPLLLMTDQEGGQVRRLPGEPVLSAKQIGASAHPWATATREGRLGAENLHGVGLNVNLAPVLDVFRKPGNFIDEFGRSFSNNPAKVAKLGSLFATAEQQQGIAATVKHFPGLGAATRTQNTDERPVTLNVPLDKLRSIDELPYKSAIAANVKLTMVSWAIYPALDKKNPAGLSSTIVQNELRKRLGFTGVTITDALEAGALKNFGDTANRAKLASRAGMDLLLCAAQNFLQGNTARNALRSDYLASSPADQAVFKAAVARVIALRTWIASQ
jgi:beta-N-acetylhexosaminidase